MKKNILLALALLSLGTIFCTTQTAGQATATPDVSASVNATLTALAAQSIPTAIAGPAVVPTDTPGLVPGSSFPTGVIRGKLSYPSEMIPPERIVAWNTADGSYYSFDTSLGQADYHMELPTGTYHVVAYLIGSAGMPSGLAGGYTQMVPCGLTAACTDHTLIDVNVTAGADLTDIDPADWYADLNSFPPMPK